MLPCHFAMCTVSGRTVAFETQWVRPDEILSKANRHPHQWRLVERGRLIEPRDMPILIEGRAFDIEAIA